MKKIFQILCVFLLVGSVNAQVRMAVSPNNRGQVKMEQSKQSKAMSHQGPRKVTKAMPAHVEQEIIQQTAIMYSSQVYAGDNLYFVRLGSDYIFEFYMNATSLADNQEYTIANGGINDTYSAVSQDGESWYSVSVASYKQWTDEKGVLHIAATMTSGDYTFNITFVSVQEPTVTNFQAGFTQKYNTYDVAFVGDFESFAYWFSLKDVQTPVEGKVYTLSDMDTNYATGIFDGENIYTPDVATYKEWTDQDGFHAEGSMTIWGVTYKLSYKRVIPTKYDSIDVVINMVQKMDYIATDGYAEFFGYSDDSTYYAQCDIIGSSIIGTFDEQACDPTYNFIYVNDVKMVTIKATAVIEAGDNGAYTVNSYVYCENGHCYHITYNFVVPAATTKVTLSGTQLMVDDYTTSQGELVVFGMDASQNTMNLDIITNKVAGTYTEEDFLFQTTQGLASYIVYGNKTYQIYSANVSVVDNGNETYTVTGTILCYGDIEFTINFTNASTGLLELTGNVPQSTRKLFNNGMLYILRDGTLFDAQGNRVE